MNETLLSLNPLLLMYRLPSLLICALAKLGTSFPFQFRFPNASCIAKRDPLFFSSFGGNPSTECSPDLGPEFLDVNFLFLLRWLMLVPDLSFIAWVDPSPDVSPECGLDLLDVNFALFCSGDRLLLWSSDLSILHDSCVLFDPFLAFFNDCILHTKTH